MMGGQESCKILHFHRSDDAVQIHLLQEAKGWQLLTPLVFIQSSQLLGALLACLRCRQINTIQGDQRFNIWSERPVIGWHISWHT